MKWPWSPQTHRNGDPAAIREKITHAMDEHDRLSDELRIYIDRLTKELAEADAQGTSSAS